MFATYISDFIVKSLKSLSTYRNYLYGIAILLVIFYHAPIRDSITFMKIFQGGMVGVDIFIFISGFGLCYSFTRHNLKTFYWHRYTRILPLFIIYATLLTCFHIKNIQSSFSLWDWVCNLSTLSYYQVGGCFVDWYISALCIYYLLFPIIYRITNIWTTIIIFVLIIICYGILGRPYWMYDAAISRVPIFMAGILYYKDIRRLIYLIFIFLLSAPICLLLKLGFSLFNVCYVCILIIVLLLPVRINSIRNNIFIKFIFQVISIIGKYSLEFYISNLIVISVLYGIFSPSNKYASLMFYLFSNSIVALLLIPISDKINSFLKKNTSRKLFE